MCVQVLVAQLATGKLRSVMAAMFIVLLGGCVVHKITPTQQYDAGLLKETGVGSERPLPAPRVIRINRGPEGWQCFEPMLYVFTLGIIPAHCLDRYHVSPAGTPADTDMELETHFEVSSVQGWVSLFLVLSPRWNSGYLDEPEAEIQRIIKQGE